MSSGTANVASIKLLHVFCDVKRCLYRIPIQTATVTFDPSDQIKRRGNINVYHGKLRKKIHLFIIFFLISLKNYQTVDRFNERVQKGTEKKLNTQEWRKEYIVQFGGETLNGPYILGHVKGIPVSILPLLFRLFILQAKVTKILLDYLPSYLRIKAILFLQPLLCQVQKTIGIKRD